MTSRTQTLAALTAFLAAAVACVCATPAAAQYSTADVPAAAKEIGVDPKIGDYIPLDVNFVDSDRRVLELGELFGDGLPVFVTLNYSNCPGLCVAQLTNLTKALNELHDMRLGEDFRLVSISIDPGETPERLRGTKERYTATLSERHDARGWHFLRGSSSSIAKIAAATGFRYTYDAQSKQFNHAAVAIGVAPDGRITRYLYDLGLEGPTLRLALVETSQGKLGTIGDQLMLWCYHFNPNENKYTASARRLMSIGGGVFVVVALAGLLPFWLTHRGRPGAAGEGAKHSEASDETSQPAG